MPIQYGPDGIITQNLNEILDEREQSLRLIMGEQFVIKSTDPIGNMELADANSELSIQELIAWLIPNQLDANTATGIFLDTICEKNRIYRKQPQYTTLNLLINGVKNTVLSSNDLTVSDSINGIYYNLNEDCIIGEDGKVLANFICQEYGENHPLETSEFNILTPLVGLNSVTMDYENVNLVLGRLTETDEELRRRRNLSVQQTSTTLAESIKASLYSLNGVKHVRHFENDKNYIDENGLPPKSFEYIVYGGDENEITDVIFVKKTLGTQAYGTTIKKKVDSEGNVYLIGYTKAEEVNIGIKIDIKVSSSQSETWKNNLKESLLKKFEETQLIGTTVKNYDYFVVLTSLKEITDIIKLDFFKADSPDITHQQISIGSKQIAKLDVENIILNMSIG